MVSRGPLPPQPVWFCDVCFKLFAFSSLFVSVKDMNVLRVLASPPCLRHDWDQRAVDQGSMLWQDTGRFARPCSPRSPGLTPVAKRLSSAQRLGTCTPERDKPASGRLRRQLRRPRPGATCQTGRCACHGPFQVETNPVSVPQRQAGSTCPHRVPQPCPALPGRTGSGPFLPGSHSSALRGDARGRRRRRRSRPRPRRRRLLMPSGMGRGRAAPGAAGCRRPLQVGQVGGAGGAGRCSSGGRAAAGRRGGADYKPQGGPRPTRRGFNRTWGRWREAVPGGAAPRLAAPGGGRAETRLQPGESPGQGGGRCASPFPTTAGRGHP